MLWRLSAIRLALYVLDTVSAVGALSGIMSDSLRYPSPTGDDKREQENVLHSMNGKKIVFIGDSITRCVSGLCLRYVLVLQRSLPLWSS